MTSVVEPVDAIGEEVSADRVVTRVRKLGLRPSALPPEYTYRSLALCIIDAVFSIGVRYETVRATIDRFCRNTGWSPFGRDRNSADAGDHQIGEFIDLFNGLSPELAARQLFGNRQRTSSRKGILKAEACRLFAGALSDAGIHDFTDLSGERLAIAEAGVRTIPGQGSGVSFGYFRMLAGDDDLVKPDRMVQRFVAAAIGARDVDASRAGLLVRLASRRIAETDPNWTPINLDYAIWLYERSPAERVGANT